MRLQLPFVSRRWHDAEVAAARAETDRLRDQRDKAIKDRETAEFTRGRILRQLADADSAMKRLYDRNLELGRRISRLTEADPEYAARLEQRIERLQRVGARLLAAASEERRRADRVQKRLDQALGLDHALIAAGAKWQDRREQKMRFDK